MKHTLLFCVILVMVSLSEENVGRSVGFSCQHCNIIWYLNRNGQLQQSYVSILFHFTVSGVS